MKKAETSAVVERHRHDDEIFRLRARVADLECVISKMTTKLQRAEAQSAAFRGSVEAMAALIAHVGLATGK